MIVPQLAAALALVLGLQVGGGSAIAIRNDNPETWSVEYPRLIQPQVADYRGCLSFTIRLVQGVADFEAQHRSDLPRCAREREEAVAQSIAALDGAKTAIAASEVVALFDAIGAIHIQRGRDLDRQFLRRVEAAERGEAGAEASRPKPLVITLENPAVVKLREPQPQLQPQSQSPAPQGL